MLEQLKKEVYEANMKLVEYSLVDFTWGNVSGIDRKNGLVVIKPSGVPYDKLCPDNMVVVDLEGNTVEGDLNPSSDTPTHIALYKGFLQISSVAHTHSKWATSFAQAKRDIKPYGTTHADYFFGEIPCTRTMTGREISEDYEKNTGLVIIEEFRNRKITPDTMPAVLVASHGPFTFGTSCAEAASNAKYLEIVANMAYLTEEMSKLRSYLTIGSIKKSLSEKHFFRKHGKDAYYGQKEKK